MPRFHVDPEEHGLAAGGVVAKLRDPLLRLPVGHTRIGEPARGEDGGVGARGDVVVGAVGRDPVVGSLVREGIAPLGPLRRCERQRHIAHGVEDVDERDRADDACPEIGTQVGDGAHEHAAGGAAQSDDVPGRAVAVLDEVLGAGDEVGEGVYFLLLAPVLEPTPALLRAAAHVGHGPDEAAVDERKIADREARIHRDTVRSVAVEQDGRLAVERGVRAHEHRERHLGAVLGVGVEAAGDVLLRIVSRGDFLRLPEGARSRDEVVVEPLLGRRGRVVDEADRRRAVLVAVRQAQGERVFFEGDGVLPHAGVRNEDAVVRVLSHQPDEVSGAGRQRDHELARRVGDEVCPRGPARRVRRGLHDLEIARPVRVGAEDEPTVPVLHVVLQADRPRLHYPRRRRGRSARDEPRLARLVVAGGDDYEVAGLRRVDGQEESPVRLVVDQDIVRDGTARGAAKHLGRPAVIVPPDPEQVRAVGRPDEVSSGALHRARQERSGGQIAHVDAVHLGALLVRGVGEERVIRTVVSQRDVKVRLALGLRVRVQQHLFWAAASGPPRVLGLLRAQLVPQVVLPRAVDRGHRAVVLLDAPFHLLEHLRLEGLRGGEHGAGVGVLFDQVCLGVGFDQCRIAQDFLPVVVLHPGVVVDPDAAELLDALRLLLGSGRNGARGGDAGAGHLAVRSTAICGIRDARTRCCPRRWTECRASPWAAPARSIRKSRQRPWASG